MALKVKAVERLLKFDKESAGEYRYVMKPEMYSTLSQAKVIRRGCSAQRRESGRKYQVYAAAAFSFFLEMCFEDTNK